VRRDRRLVLLRQGRLRLEGLRLREVLRRHPLPGARRHGHAVPRVHRRQHLDYRPDCRLPPREGHHQEPAVNPLPPHRVRHRGLQELELERDPGRRFRQPQ
jgi:hypothetical protein